jgi:hypothetical protein
MTRSRQIAHLPVLAGILLLAGCSGSEPESGSSTARTPEAGGAAAGQVEHTDVPRNVYWGDTHVHTGWSADAGLDGAVKTPTDAYRLARGEEVESNTGQKAKLHRAYDWFAVTDHSDGMGVVNEIVAGNPELMANDTLRGWRDALKEGGEAAGAAKSELIRMQSNGQLPKEVMDPKWMSSAWEKTIAAAEDFNEPGTFTTFIAYEWTVNAGGGDNLHRNVIYRDGADRASQMLPLTTFETQDPEKLWEWMANYETKTGGRLLAIPHNGNLSNGRMFEEQRFDGSSMTREWAETRAKYEPLFEVTQIKGQSESHPTLSPNDDFADWDRWDFGNLIAVPKPKGAIRTEYWREALKSGMRIEAELGANPFQYGANGATDTHTGLSTAEEDNFFGKFKTVEPRAERWNFPLIEGAGGKNIMGWQQAAAGTMGVWATANTREAIWDAMMRKETYGSTGPRISVRFFGGYDFGDNDLSGEMVEAGYARGVPMGGDLAAPPSESAKPTFLIAAMKDPDGANLDRVQVIKGWVDASGKTQEQVFDVKWSGDRQPGADGKVPAVGNTVDLETAEYTNSIGAAELVGVFRDPEFDPSLRAFYYVRVLEIPTPTWLLYDKVRFNLDNITKEAPLTHQERAITSPIWYTPR